MNEGLTGRVTPGRKRKYEAKLKEDGRTGPLDWLDIIITAYTYLALTVYQTPEGRYYYYPYLTDEDTRVREIIQPVSA